MFVQFLHSLGHFAYDQFVCTKYNHIKMECIWMQPVHVTNYKTKFSNNKPTTSTHTHTHLYIQHEHNSSLMSIDRLFLCMLITWINIVTVQLQQHFRMHISLLWDFIELPDHCRLLLVNMRFAYDARIKTLTSTYPIFQMVNVGKLDLIRLHIK